MQPSQAPRFVRFVYLVCLANIFVWLHLRFMSAFGVGSDYSYTDLLARPLVFALGLSQLALHALGSVFLPGRWSVRLAISLVVLFVWFLSWQIGYAMCFYRTGNVAAEFLGRDFWRSLAVLLIVAVASQFPLWIMRGFFRWRIQSLAERDADQPDLTIRQIMVLMALVALALVIADGAYRISFLRSGSIYEIGKNWEGDIRSRAITLAIQVAIVSPLWILPFAASVLRGDWLRRGIVKTLGCVGICYAGFLGFTALAAKP